MISRVSSIIFTLFNLFLYAPIAHAQGLKNAGSKLDQTAKPAGVEGTGSIDSVVGTGIRVALSLVGIIFLVLMVYAGYLWMTARGEETQIDKAKDIISAAIIGLVIVMGAYAITTLVMTRFAQ
jgi:hypothetical protein